ncbi:hypothetical protein AMATHDRAFT_47911 [Amanita thiersii Skay4041]|uniref:NADAR domain-containing protein n=1 Tax=Amanita thiersii Skay4041 TaxID=703135 RepID=A0A2A9NQ18_9AGAR|nr:hypothetical protein AMATHDRAFT_47911 [Amanita thiersii Skay4041]
MLAHANKNKNPSSSCSTPLMTEVSASNEQPNSGEPRSHRISHSEVMECLDQCSNFGYNENTANSAPEVFLTPSILDDPSHEPFNSWQYGDNISYSPTSRDHSLEPFEEPRENLRRAVAIDYHDVKEQFTGILATMINRREEPASAGLPVVSRPPTVLLPRIVPDVGKGAYCTRRSLFGNDLVHPSRGWSNRDTTTTFGRRATQSDSPTALDPATNGATLESPLTTSSTTTNPIYLGPPATNSSDLPPFFFTNQEPYSGFTNDSPHPIEYWGKTYQTATHLFEALKYIRYRPDFAESIRNCQSTEDARQMSVRLGHDGKASADWESYSLSMIQGMLYAKFNQHISLRHLLLATPSGPLVYYNVDDGYWGSGVDGNGLNVLGRALDKVKSLLGECSCN